MYGTEMVAARQLGSGDSWSTPNGIVTFLEGDYEVVQCKGMDAVAMKKEPFELLYMLYDGGADVVCTCPEMCDLHDVESGDDA